MKLRWISYYYWMYNIKYEKQFDLKRKLLTRILFNIWLRYVKHTCNKWRRKILFFRYKNQSFALADSRQSVIINYEIQTSCFRKMRTKERAILFICYSTNRRKYKNDTNVRKNNIISLNYRSPDFKQKAEKRFIENIQKRFIRTVFSKRSQNYNIDIENARSINKSFYKLSHKQLTE